MKELTLTLNADHASVVTGKKGKRHHQQRLTWTCENLRLRLDTSVDETGRVKTDWALWLGSVLYSTGPSLEAEGLIEALREGFGLSRPQAEMLTLAWVSQARQQAWEPRHAGEAWARKARVKS